MLVLDWLVLWALLWRVCVCVWHLMVNSEWIGVAWPKIPVCRAAPCDLWAQLCKASWNISSSCSYFVDCLRCWCGPVRYTNCAPAQLNMATNQVTDQSLFLLFSLSLSLRRIKVSSLRWWCSFSTITTDPPQWNSGHTPPTNLPFGLPCHGNMALEWTLWAWQPIIYLTGNQSHQVLGLDLLLKGPIMCKVVHAN